MRIFLDAGHGGSDPGAINGTRKEKDDNLAITKAVGSYLTSQGIDIRYTRLTDVYDSPSTKAHKAIVGAADYLVSFHRNSTKGAQGFEVFAYNTIGKGYKMAVAVNEAMKKTAFKNRGVKISTSLAVLRNTFNRNIPAILLEVGFINDAGDNAIFDNNRSDLVTLIGDAIMDAAGWIKKVSPETVTTQAAQATSEYKVRVTTNTLFVRREATLNSAIVEDVHKNEVYTIVSVSTANGLQWGKLQSGAGYIALKYTEKV